MFCFLLLFRRIKNKIKHENLQVNRVFILLHDYLLRVRYLGLVHGERDSSDETVLLQNIMSLQFSDGLIKSVERMKK